MYIRDIRAIGIPSGTVQLPLGNIYPIKPIVYSIKNKSGITNIENIHNDKSMYGFFIYKTGNIHNQTNRHDPIVNNDHVIELVSIKSISTHTKIATIKIIDNIKNSSRRCFTNILPILL